MRSLNPGIKLLATVMASLMLSLTYNVPVNLVVAASCLLVTLLTPGVNRRRLALTMVPFALTALAFFTTGLFFGTAGDASGVQTSAFGQRTLYATDWTTAMQLASRVLAYGGLGVLFAFTSNAFELVMSLMQQFRLPPKFAYGVLAAYHFFPVVTEEFSVVGAALKVRGVRASPFSTKRLLPMLAHALERSESLAMAMESRGFEDGAPRRVAFRVPVRARAVFFLVAVPAAIAAGLTLLR